MTVVDSTNSWDMESQRRRCAPILGAVVSSFEADIHYLRGAFPKLMYLPALRMTENVLKNDHQISLFRSQPIPGFPSSFESRQSW